MALRSLCYNGYWFCFPLTSPARTLPFGAAMNLRRLSSVSLGHLVIDVLGSSVAMILTALAVPFALSNSEIGLGVMIYQLVGSLTQPYFGWLADRLGGRWLGALGLAWTAAFYWAATFATSYGGLLLLMSLAALGSAAFHPQGAMNASDAGRRRASSATAIFFLLGQTGLALGPMLAGVLLENSGLAGVRILAGAAVPFVFLMAFWLGKPADFATHAAPSSPPSTASDSSSPAASTPASAGSSLRRSVFVAFVLVVALRATAQSGFYGLLPKFLADQGYTPSAYGLMVGIFSIALALGTLGGGLLGDRFSHRTLLIWACLLSTPFAVWMLNSTGPAFVAASALAGLLVGVPHSILVVMAQNLLPKRQGLASGSVLGFMFAAGAAGTGLAGWAADFVGLPLVLLVIALLPLGAGLSAFFLERPHQYASAAMTASVPGD
ncbi:MAG: MFS transporter [Caldilineaceae bacterium]|nr:MFS transporter [Caldilineaceae bacterium]